MNLALIGLRCAGKSTIGRLVSARLGWPFVDLDQRVLNSFHQASIKTVWAEYGESGWREAEVECLRHALARDRQVIALGGGVPMIEAARELIRTKQDAAALRIVFLECCSDELERRRRAINDDDRPPLANESLREEIERTQRERGSTYAAMADMTIDVTALEADAAADEIVRWCEASNDTPSEPRP